MAKSTKKNAKPPTGPAGPRTAAEAKAAYDARKTGEWDRRKKVFDEEAKKNGTHTVATLEALGLYTRGGEYRAYGFAYIKRTTSRRRVYDVSGKLLGERLKALGRGSKKEIPGSPGHGRQYRLSYIRRDFETGPRARQNFLWSAGMPYPHEAHHIIPDQAFDLAFTTAEHRKALRMVPYDLNHGENIILLPKHPRDSQIHRLVTHNGSHGKYTDLVVSDMKEKRSMLKGSNCEEGKPPPVAILDDFIGLQNKYWKMIVKWGKLNCSQTVNEAAVPTLKAVEAAAEKSSF